MSRPEHIAPPEIFYGEDEARKYTDNSRITAIQAEMAYRALELLNLSEGPKYILDIGCGSGLSGEILEEEGHVWVGMDISSAMLDVANEREVEGDLFLQDAGQGMAFRPGTFDGCISVSVLQWLCNADKAINRPKARIQRFFSTLYASLTKGARAVFQFYPENDDQIQLIIDVATKCGFEGGLLVDYPNSKKAKKYYLCLFAGTQTGIKNQMPKALGEDGEVHPDDIKSIQYENRRQASRKRRSDRKGVKDRNWINNKKRIARDKGDKVVANDSKFTGRKRKVRF
ncbi:S-adenosyl-L-methionine-dependent methyltransferase [Gilbertella persicaria]|uniref:S-adenosyl-L-methionine-dependent methyltransferase n=1 Tax=Gilbertella persicaria TaxID=101096 RepID=UPI00221F1713|nr:S-adenosyl-L-methionine-dependent methyltransferase [Gilbertella persicaria]KAI8087610.1 S-adenosyl-L-methionine-dependent methyltransferase [Gilbertella persicaria]